jgi:hypothetical protein
MCLNSACAVLVLGQAGEGDEEDIEDTHSWSDGEVIVFNVSSHTARAHQKAQQNPVGG